MSSLFPTAATRKGTGPWSDHFRLAHLRFAPMMTACSLVDHTWIVDTSIGLCQPARVSGDRRQATRLQRSRHGTSPSWKPTRYPPLWGRAVNGAKRVLRPCSGESSRVPCSAIVTASSRPSRAE